MKITITILFVFILNIGFAQNKEIDSLKYALSVTRQDTARALIMAKLCEISRETNIDTAIFYGNKDWL